MPSRVPAGTPSVRRRGGLDRRGLVGGYRGSCAARFASPRLSARRDDPWPLSPPPPATPLSLRRLRLYVCDARGGSAHAQAGVSGAHALEDRERVGRTRAVRGLYAPGCGAFCRRVRRLYCRHSERRLGWHRRSARWPWPQKLRLPLRWRPLRRVAVLRSGRGACGSPWAGGQSAQRSCARSAGPRTCRAFKGAGLMSSGGGRAGEVEEDARRACASRSRPAARSIRPLMLAQSSGQGAGEKLTLRCRSRWCPSRRGRRSW